MEWWEYGTFRATDHLKRKFNQTFNLMLFYFILVNVILVNSSFKLIRLSVQCSWSVTESEHTCEVCKVQSVSKCTLSIFPDSSVEIRTKQEDCSRDQSVSLQTTHMFTGTIDSCKKPVIPSLFPEPSCLPYKESGFSWWKATEGRRASKEAIHHGASPLPPTLHLRSAVIRSFSCLMWYDIRFTP